MIRPRVDARAYAERFEASIPVSCRICWASTSLRKPYCRKHIQHMPYVKGIKRDAQ